MNSGLTIRSSNQIEILAAQLARLISRPADGSLVPEVVVVQSRGMQRWLSLTIARRFGIAANIQYPFPNTFINDLFEIFFPDLPSESPFEPETLRFRIMNLLPELLDRQPFAPLRNYLKHDPQGLKRFQLAGKLADLYDQYLVFRPDSIMNWERGERPHEPDQLWQAELWRRLSKDHRDIHRARLRLSLIAKLKSAPALPPELPARIMVFGLSYLPPFYLEIFTALAGTIVVELFVLSPSREYWGDILSEAEIHRTLLRHADDSVGPEALYLESGNRLLASLGTQGKDFLNFISELNCQWIEQYEALPADSLLGRIQSDMFHLHPNKTPAVREESRPEGFPADDSIQIHSCHSPMREIEVLHDRLLNLFEADPDLCAGDIVVMAPDIETYAPYIRAVFETPGDPATKMPFSIADRTIPAQSRAVQSFLALLNINRSRFPAGGVIDLLQAPGIREKFDLSEPDLDRIQQWVEKLNIRWGLDAEYRSQLSQPGWPENTWKAGLQRLLLGYALPVEQDRLFHGILPYGPLDSDEARILGQLMQFLERLLDLARQLDRPRTLERWRDRLLTVLERFIEPDPDNESDMQILRDIIDRLGRQQSLSGYHEAAEFDVIRAFIEHALKGRTFESGFLSGGVTFCAMLPMRSIPFKVVCLIGMNSGSFPRESHSPGFDLIRRYPRAGDRQRRNDDRYLFLEALLSARSTLYISYLGQDVTDNSRIPPSVLVSELLAYIEQHYGVQAGDMVLEHPLQAYSARYFDPAEDQLFSYSKDNYDALKQTGSIEPKAVFFDKPFKTVPAEFRHLDVGDLSRFFSHPARFFLQKRLGLTLHDIQSTITDSENFVLSPLDRYTVQKDLLAVHNDGRMFDGHLTLQKAKGTIPAGKVGKVALSELYAKRHTIKQKQRQLTGSRDPDFLDIDLKLNTIRITGTLADIYPAGMVRLNFGQKRSRYILAHWIQHLVFGAAAQFERQTDSYLIFDDGDLQFGPVNNPIVELERLLAVYIDGMCSPLPLFPETSLAFARGVIHKGLSNAEALKKSRSRWLGSDFSRGEIQDDYYMQCFGRCDPLDDRFIETALTVFEPIFKHMKEDPDKLN